MAALVGNAIRSKLTDQLTERSLKFYDGTYRWDSDGFEDENGGKFDGPVVTWTSVLTTQVYRPFNDDDPLCRPPTPNPPESLSDDENEDRSSESPVRDLSLSPLQRKLTDSISHSSGPVNHSRLHSVVKRPTPSITLFPTTRALLQDNASEAAAYMAGHKKTLLRDDLFLDKEHAVQERLKGRLEGILIGKWYEEAGLTIEESYEQVGIPFPDDIVKPALVSAAVRQGTRVIPVETKGKVIRLGGQKGPSETADPFPDLSSDLSSELSDPPSEMEDATGAGPEADPVSGRKEACSTPVNAKDSDLSRPARIDLLGRSGRSRGKRGIGGGGGGSDEDDDDGEDKDRKKGPRDDHESAKPRRKKKKDDDEEDDGDKEEDGGNDGGGGGDNNVVSRNTDTNRKSQDPLSKILTVKTLTDWYQIKNLLGTPPRVPRMR
jgi:hypothetical protein